MKCDELKRYEVRADYDAGTIAVPCENDKYGKYMLAEDVMEAIAELKEKLRDHCIHCPVKEQEDDVVAEKDKESTELKAKFDKAIAELKDKLRHYPMMVALLESDKKEIAELKAKLENVNELVKTTRQMLEDVKAAHYAKSVDAGIRERRLHRALWLILADLHNNKGFEYLMKANACVPQSSTRSAYMRMHDRKVLCEKRCRVKAEEYK